ncbi:hypothetical protein F5Y17DRAFT_214383 [Xylariaceae sp. FL0594]|nr:hypothetical protein F5Y17DRAFT_214383 [Xylariaceae sp. FL0594]
MALPSSSPDGPSLSAKGKEPVAATWPAPSDPLLHVPGSSSRRQRLSHSTFTQPQPEPGDGQPTSQPRLFAGNIRTDHQSSNTWASSGDDADLPSDEEDPGDWETFVREYNRLAQRHGIRPLIYGDFLYRTTGADDSVTRRRGSWLSKILQQNPEPPDKPIKKSDNPRLRHHRSLSDVALSLVPGSKRDGRRSKDLKTLVRLCGKSSLFLPAGHAPCTLALPTCLRALAKALVDHADMKGLFRVPGSVRAVNVLYDYYCADEDTRGITSTTRCPSLPTHIPYDAHDVAAAFKRILAGLPGGILGSLALFDAFVAIHSQLQGQPEQYRTKETKLRARLIALAIGTVKSRYRKELICAVFGLLSFVGRIAEIAPREDGHGHPLPTSDLMGYHALGIVFGPLLVGDLIHSYSMRVADPAAGLVLLPVSPPKSRKVRHKLCRREREKGKSRPEHEQKASTSSTFTVDKIHIANTITEMLIVHWRDIVRQMKDVGALKPKRPGTQRRPCAPDKPSRDTHQEHSGPRSGSSYTYTPTTSGKINGWPSLAPF